jgi:hypothetical protein
MLSSLATLVILFEVFKAEGNPVIPIAGAAAMIVPVIVVPVVSLLTPPPSRKILDRAFGKADEA